MWPKVTRVHLWPACGATQQVGFPNDRQVGLPRARQPRPLALRPVPVTVVVGLVAACDVAESVSPGRALPCSARRAHPRLCDVRVSARSGAKMCSGRACAVLWKCVLECAPWAARA